MNKAKYKYHKLSFIRPGGTSRGIMTEKDCWFIKLSKDGKTGIGEVGFLKGLSIDNFHEIENILDCLEKDMDSVTDKELEKFPAIRFAIEQAGLDMMNGGEGIYFPGNFTSGKIPVPINGLIWMGDLEFMRQQVKEKLKAGFRCIKLKIGAINFEEEVGLLRMIRKEFHADEIEIRVDANGAFRPDDAIKKINILSELKLHSIEQPIMAGQWEEMHKLCEKTPVPIALDEELIGINNTGEKQLLIESIRPQYIILKPSLLGGFKSSEEWIRIAEKNNTGWWITSALESNIGLSAIAQWTSTLGNKMPQGLGTGRLFSNNFQTQLELTGDLLFFNPSKKRESPF